MGVGVAAAILGATVLIGGAAKGIGKRRAARKAEKKYQESAEGKREAALRSQDYKLLSETRAQLAKGPQGLDQAQRDARDAAAKEAIDASTAGMEDDVSRSMGSSGGYGRGGYTQNVLSGLADRKLAARGQAGRATDAYATTMAQQNQQGLLQREASLRGGAAAAAAQERSALAGVYTAGAGSLGEGIMAGGQTAAGVQASGHGGAPVSETALFNKADSTDAGPYR